MEVEAERLTADYSPEPPFVSSVLIFQKLPQTAIPSSFCRVSLQAAPAGAYSGLIREGGPLSLEQPQQQQPQHLAPGSCSECFIRLKAVPVDSRCQTECGTVPRRRLYQLWRMFVLGTLLVRRGGWKACFGLACLQLHSCVMCMSLGTHFKKWLLRSHAAFSFWLLALLNSLVFQSRNENLFGRVLWWGGGVGLLKYDWHIKIDRLFRLS